ncbi:MAG: 2-oxoacid:ferredoxin oxidoreductase subunit beta [Chloroflexota bacterium]
MLPEIQNPHPHQPEVSPLPAGDWFESSETLHKLRKHKKFPTIWCSGCGIGIVMGALIRAIDHIGLDSNNVALVSGIGCTARMPVYMDFNTLHTTHGRALAFATGLKLARPDMHVIVIMGDGDSTAIGGNHFIHAARRNIGITTIIVNNNIYGMTGGQVSPTTPHEARATTAPYGNIEYPMPISELAITAGATYVARSTVYHAMELDKYIKDAILKDGFSLVEAISYCHTTFGRLNKLGSAAEMLGLIKENSLSHTAYEKLSPELQAANTKYVRGVLHNIDHRIEYTRAYDSLIERLNHGAGK